MMNIFFKKTTLAAMVAMLALAVLPVTSAYASGENPPTATVSNARLELIWARQTARFERLARVFEDSDAQISRIQTLIDKAAANGKEVSAIQAALDAFKAALKNAKPIYESIKGIVNSHQGFDVNGKVTDLEAAKSTVQGMHDKMLELKTTMDGSGKALRDAIKAFRDANRPSTPMPAG
jgi:hypothetical protein